MDHDHVAIIVMIGVIGVLIIFTPTSYSLIHFGLLPYVVALALAAFTIAALVWKLVFPSGIGGIG